MTLESGSIGCLQKKANTLSDAIRASEAMPHKRSAVCASSIEAL